MSKPMKNATFYVLETDATSDGLSAVEALVCNLAETRWRAGKRVLIACEDEQQAIRLDEALWQRPANAFVPHNLAGRRLSWLGHSVAAVHRVTC
jgi:DNA polymerase-3 subunit chi